MATRCLFTRPHQRVFPTCLSKYGRGYTTRRGRKDLGLRMRVADITSSAPITEFYLPAAKISIHLPVICDFRFQFSCPRFGCVLYFAAWDQFLTCLYVGSIMSAESSTNGIATPVSSKYSNLALTEYSTVPTPDSENDDGKQLGSPPNWGIPDAFLLPNGYPDVRYSTQFSRKRQFSSSLTHSPPYSISD